MTPNPEQRLAIEHHGGVLLKAGAGSGKTYVLVEHIIFLLKEQIVKYQGDFDTFRIELRSMLKEIVLMTFTNKAAGEIKIRLKKRIAGIEQNDYWKIIDEEIDILKTTTIHGFFYSLIKEGLAPDIPSDLNIVSEAKTLAKIENLFNSWLGNADKNDFALSMIRLKKNQFLEAFQKIFLTPELRVYWEESEKNDLNFLFDQGVKDIFELHDLNSKLSSLSTLSGDYSKFKDKTWYLFMEEFSVQGFNSISSVKELDALFRFLESHKIPRRPLRKYDLNEADLFYDTMASLKDLAKKLQASILYINSEPISSLESFETILNSLFDAINDSYFLDRNISFSDIEYLIAKASIDPNFIKLVSNRYRYFIIDEFQDTSHIQYEILSRLALHDYKRFFCIGDIKQAIYGFRGGEIGVFLDMEQKVPSVLSLKNNYRSDQRITEFNNDFYSKVLNAGKGFSGTERKTIHFDTQTVPDDKPQGKVISLDMSIESEEKIKLSSSDLDRYEAQALFEKISKLKASSGSIAILYKKLKPSQDLIKLLIQNNISFTAQVKLPLADDPLIGIFKIFVHLVAKPDVEDETHLYLINKYLELLNKEQVENINWFQENNLTGFYPLTYLFSDFLNFLGLSTSLHEQSLATINDIIINNKEDAEAIYVYLESLGSDNYSIPFKYGTTPEKIQIMTTHASKGLEFNHVFLGGLYTNGRGIPTTDLIGSLPGSFKFFTGGENNKQLPTPVFYFENLLKDNKEFSESKRLLYVATTRAENSLYWVNLTFDNVKATILKTSWITAFEEFGNLAVVENEVLPAISIKSSDDEPVISSPLFHHIDLGIINKPKRDHYILSELSVTGLTSLALCPRMFYFSNILKIKPEDIQFLDKPKEWPIYENSEDEIENHLKSSATRGTLIHSHIEYAIKHNFVLPRESSQKFKSLDWTLEYLKAYRETHHFISEEMVKFKLFGYMISGVPDLILKNNADEKDQIIDFKTGAIKEDNNQAYWFQLYCYAYYLFHNTHSTHEIVLKLVYTDESKVLEKIVSLDMVKEYLEKYFKLTQKPNLINQDSCARCSYGNICQRP